VVDDLTKEYAVGGGVFGRAKRTIRAVDDVNIDVQPGESVGLVGESGAGKTTVGRLVLGLVTPSSGAVSFEGVDSKSLSKSALRAQRRDIQVIYQNPYASLDPLMTVGDTVAEPLDIHMNMSPDERRVRVIELLSQVGLDDSYRFRYPHQLSGGQRQRVAIARALALKPKLIVCDEPISSLDVSTQAQVINLLNDLKAETGIAYLFIGHDLEVVHHISDRVAVMYLGRVVEWGPSDEVYANPRHPYTRMLLGSVLSTDPTNRRLFTMADDTGVQEAPPPGGCPFAPRCPDAIDECLTTDPPPVHVRGVSVRCIRVVPEMADTTAQRSAV
jgi:oligopeptide/dipeptide ABC transporter ATP-binding protein